MKSETIQTTGNTRYISNDENFSSMTKRAVEAYNENVTNKDAMSWRNVMG